MRNTVDLHDDRRPAGVVRVHAYEFGGSVDPRDPGRRGLRDLRATRDFPACAVAPAQLRAIDIRQSDLWRLLDPETVDGAIVVWPTSPGIKLIEGFGDRPSADNFANRVISLVKVDCPSVRSARSRASLNVRSIAFEESSWQRHAPGLMAIAASLLRNDFESLIESGTGIDLQVPHEHEAGSATTGDVPSPLLTLLLNSMIRRCPTRLGQKSIVTEAEFWGLAGEGLRRLPAEMREHVSLASGFAAPFAPAIICYDSADHGGAATLTDALLDHRSNPVSLNVATAPVFFRPAEPFGQLMSFGRDSRNPRKDPAHDAPGSESAAIGIAREIDEINREPAILTRLSGLAELALRLPPAVAAEACGATILLLCENELLKYLSVNGFLLPDELEQVQKSPALSAVIRRIVERRPHAIVARLQVSLTILASIGPSAAACVDACLRRLLPPEWSATQWLALFEEEWAIRQGLSALRRARQVPPREMANIEAVLLGRLACDSLAARRPGAASRPKSTPARASI